ncbi:MAG: hypothetical protein ACHQSE_12750 [Gemmatimonadales bacterium]
MRHLSSGVVLLVFAAACASGGKTGGSETTVAPSTTSLVVGSSAMGTMNINQSNNYTAIATPVPVSQDSAYALLTRAYVMLEIPVVPVDQKRAVGNDGLSIRRRIAGMPMQKVVDCGDKMGLPNAETWDIHMNILSYVEPGPNGNAQILTRIQAMGNAPDLSNRDLTPCPSLGDLEKKISDLVLKLASNK